MNSQVKKIFKEIENLRAKNNKNWMDLLRLSFEIDPKKTTNIPLQLTLTIVSNLPVHLATTDKHVIAISIDFALVAKHVLTEMSAIWAVPQKH